MNTAKKFYLLSALFIVLSLSMASIPEAMARSNHSGHIAKGDDKVEMKKNSEKNHKNLRARLTGDEIQGKKPKGKADFEKDKHGKRLKVNVENVNLDDGIVLSVFGCDATSTAIGMITLKNHEGKLDLRTKKGDTVPKCVKGDELKVMNASTTILSGIFKKK